MFRWLPCVVIFGLTADYSSADISVGSSSGGTPLPRVVVPTSGRSMAPVRPVSPAKRILYPWKTHIRTTVFWIGEKPTQNNPTPNHMSSWDQKWAQNYGGYDDPNPSNRIANHTTGEFRPKRFVPRLNPFYIALPYNDVLDHRRHKPEASRVIPWFKSMRPEPGESVCKGRWVQIYRNNRSCYAQWEDCGPWRTDDWQYVFGSNKQPRTKQNGGAGIDISPSVRDYLGMKSGEKVHWRFVEAGQVPYGPWKKYGRTPVVRGQSGDDIEVQRRYLEYLRQLRDEEFNKRSVRDIQSR